MASPSPRRALAALSLSMLLSSLGISIANVGLPTLAQVFDAPFQAVQWIVLAYLLTITSLIVSAGRLGDLIGRRRLLLGGLALFTMASLLSGIAPTLGWLIGARALQGLGACVMMALTMAFVGETVPKERTGSAMGLLGTMSAVGTALGPSLGGVLIAAFGWPAIFLINAPLGVLAFALAYCYLPTDRAPAKATRPGFDLAGTALLATALAAYALAMTIGRGQFGFTNLALLLAFAIGTALFVRVEARVPSPLIRLPVLADPALRTGLIMSALVSTVIMATFVVGPFYLSQGLGLDTAHVGAVMSIGPLTAALTGVPAGRIADRFGAARMTVIGLSALTIGCALLATLPAHLGIPGYVVPLVICTLGYALFQTANNTAVMAEIQAEQRGVVSGMLSLSRNLGLVTGASVMGAIFAFASSGRAASDPGAAATGLAVTFAVATVLMFAALVLAVRSPARALAEPQPGE
ncbi:MAG: MFS transporter [Rhizobiales bacterium 62-17]|nr:MFS transporter [Hyphomicrobiales bacterium]OJY01791.1 MAG: MFS transporter [Rhizobiales bacterium 62-17]